MSQYTFQHFSLTELNTIEQQKSSFLDSLNIKLAAPDLLVKDLALMLKSLEIMENLEHLPEYKDFLLNIANKSADFVSPTEMIPNGGLDITYETANLVQNSSFSSDAFEVELLKNSGFDVPIDMTRPWANGIAYKFDILFTEGTQILQAFTDGQQTAVTWFEADLKPNTQYKFEYDLTVNDVNWDLLSGAENMIDQLASDTTTFSETGGGPDPVTYICSVLEDPSLVRPTCDGVEVQYLIGLAEMETACTGGGGTWYAGNINDPNTQAHTLIPYHLEARQGDTIIFTNPSTSILVHNAVSDDNISFASPDLEPGEDWAWVVDGYHDLYFHCTFHPLEEGRLTSTTNHRFVYSVDHGLNPGDTIKVPINYGANVPLPGLSNSYMINLPMPQPCTSLGGAGSQNVIESLYHDLSLDNLVTFQSGDVETNPNAGVPVDVIFSGGSDGSNTVHANGVTTVSNGIVTALELISGGSGYISIPSVYITGGGGNGATATIEFSGILNSLTVTDVGTGYQSAPTVQISAPDVATLAVPGTGVCSDPQYDDDEVNCLAEGTCSDATYDNNEGACLQGGYVWTSANNTWTPGTATTIQATATATITGGGEIDVVTITEGGTGYHLPPTVTFVGGSPTVVATVDAELNGQVVALTLTAGGIGYGSGDNSVPVGERKWEEYIITAVQKGDARVDVFFNDENYIGHVHTGELTTAEYATIQTGSNVISMTTTDGDGSGENSPHSHSVTYNWDPALNSGAGGMYLVGMTGSHNHGMENYYDISGGTKIELTNFGHYHEILINIADEAVLKATPLQGVTQDQDGTWSAASGATLIRASDYGTSDPQHFHTVELGCLDPANDIYLIIEIDFHIHDFDRVWYPGSSQFTIGHYNFALGGDDNNPTSIATPIVNIPGYVKKERGITCDTHGLLAGDRVHYQNIYLGIHHGNTNYYVDYILDEDNFVLTETVIYPLEDAEGTTPTTFNLIEEYEVVVDMASYRFEVERDITNHFGDQAAGTGVEMLWSRPRTVKSQNHGLNVGDIVQLPSGPLPYTPTELPGEMRDHTVIALGDGYGPTDHLPIVVDTQTSLTFNDPNTTTTEGAQDTPWLWTWYDRSAATYFPYQRDEAVADSFGGNDGIVGGFDVFRGGTYEFLNNAWHHSGYATMIDPFTGAPMSMYLHAAGIKAIPGAGWDNLVQAGMTRGLGDPDEGYHCISRNANHGLSIPSGTHNYFVNTDESPGTWVSDQPFPECMNLPGWCEELDVDGWYYNGVDDYAACEALNPLFADVGLAQWRASQWIGNFSKEFTWKIPEDFGLTGADGNTGFGPFVPPGAVNGYYAVEADQGLYKFDKEGMIEGTNRTINLYRGGTYRFRVNAAGHPFYITTDDGSHFTPGAYFGEYLLGVTGTRAEEGPGDQNYSGSSNFGADGSGALKYEICEFTVPSVAPDFLYYQCAWHASMIGTLQIHDIPVVNAGEDIHVYYHHGQDNMYTPLHVLDKILVDNGTSPNYFQVQPEPEYAFPVEGTQADILGTGNLATATGPGHTPSIQAMNIELGTVQYIDPLAMIPGDNSEQFLVTNNFTGTAVVYISVDVGYRSDIELDNVTFKEVVWTETGSWQVQGGTAFTQDTTAGYIEQLVTGTVLDGVTYEIQYDITEDFKDEFGAPNGTIKASLIGDTTVDGTANTVVGHYSETIVAPNNSTLFRLSSTGQGKIDNASIRERVTGQNAWYMGEGWDAVGGKAYIDGSITSPTEISQTVAFDAGKLYEVKYNVADMDPNNDGMTGRLRVALGHNPNILIANWNFDITDPALINWTMSGVDVQIVNEKLEFSSSVNGTATYTLPSSLTKNAHYESTIDTTLATHNILNFTVGPGPSGTHSHTFQITQGDADYLMADESRTRDFPQSDGYHAETYTHVFTLGYIALQWVLISQTIPEGHTDLVLTSTTQNNPTIELILDGVVQGTITESGIHHINVIGENTADVVLKVNGTGVIAHVKLYEEEIPILDHDSSGLVHQGEVKHHVRAGSHDSLIHFVADVDNNYQETYSPYYSQIGWEGSVDDVSVREIEEHWTFAPQQGAAAYVDQLSEQIYTAGTGTGARGIAHISFEMVDAMNYQVSYNVDRPTDSIIKIGPSPDSDQYGSQTIAANDTLGNKEFVFTAPVTGVAFLTLSTTGNGFTYWDNISVKTIPNLSSDEYLLLARSMNVFGIPVGGEERWRVQHLDQENMDYFGMPIAGMRTIESFGESIIEDYYDLNKRQTDVLNPPIRIDTLSVEIGERAVLTITPSCSDFITGDPLPAYTTAAACAEPNGEWYLQVDEYCSDPTYSTEVNCIEPNGTWTPGTCSNGAIYNQGDCEGEGTCSDNTYDNQEAMCLSAGTCDDPQYYDQISCEGNSGTWTSAGNTWTSAGNTWTIGSCSDVAYTDQPTCEAPRSVWTSQVDAHCQDGLGGLVPAFTSQITCNNQRGVWDMTDVTAIAGTAVEATGEGIDLDWTITIGEIEQITSAVLLPTKVAFEVTAGTPLGLQDWKIENTAGDYSTYHTQFEVKDPMRIISVYQPSPRIQSNGQVYGDSSAWNTGGQYSTGNTAEFKIYGIGFDPACSITVQKSSQDDHPQNYLAGGDNSNIYGYNTAQAPFLTWVSSTELTASVTVDDIPAGHDATIGGDKFGVMYYDVTVANPNGDTFTEKASAVPGSPISGNYGNIHDGQAADSWDPSVSESGHGIRIWGYDIPDHIRIDSITPNGATPPTAWSIVGVEFDNNGTNTLCTVEMWDYNGLGTIWTPEIYYDGSTMGSTAINIINSANDINGVAGIPPDGDYIVRITRPDGTYDTYSNIHLGL